MGINKAQLVLIVSGIDVFLRILDLWFGIFFAKLFEQSLREGYNRHLSSGGLLITGMFSRQ